MRELIDSHCFEEENPLLLLSASLADIIEMDTIVFEEENPLLLSASLADITVVDTIVFEEEILWQIIKSYIPYEDHQWLRVMCCVENSLVDNKAFSKECIYIP